MAGLLGDEWDYTSPGDYDVEDRGQMDWLYGPKNVYASDPVSWFNRSVLGEQQTPLTLAEQEEEKRRRKEWMEQQKILQGSQEKFQKLMMAYQPQKPQMSSLPRIAGSKAQLGPIYPGIRRR